MSRTTRDNANRGSHVRPNHAPETGPHAGARASLPPARGEGERGAHAAQPGMPAQAVRPGATGRAARGAAANPPNAPARAAHPNAPTPAAHSSSPTRPARAKRPRRPNFFKRTINGWCNRLLGAVSDRNLSGQEEEYAAHRTTRDYVCNTIGIAAWGMVFPFLTVVVTQLVGVEQAGMFSIAFVTGSLLMIVANYGVRTFQVSDLDEEHSFSDYQINRWITCVVMVVAGVAYCMVRGYADQMLVISIGVYLYKMVDGLADVYEGRLQQVDKLYLAGVSQAFRSVCVFVVFSLFLLVTRNLPGACVAMAVTAGATFLFLTFPLALFETPKSQRGTARGILSLFKQCFPLFVALFMYSLIDNMPKFVMEGVLSYDNQLYFNALYFPAQMILLTIGLIYKPLLVRMAETWADPEKRRRFDLSIVVIVLVIVAITLVVALVMGWIGIPVMSFMYGLDFEPFRGLCFIMLAAGGVTAAIDFLYQVITVLRRQKEVMRLYLITFGFSLFVPILLVNYTGLPGAVIGYLIVMCILLVLLVSEYIGIRLEFARQDKLAEEQPARLRPSEVRAERERREKVHAKWESGAHARRGAGAQDNQDDRDERQLPA